MQKKCADKLRGCARTFCSLIALAVISGCVVGPDFKHPLVRVPTLWSESPSQLTIEKPNLAGWWQRFNEPMLDQLIYAAVTANTDVRQAKAKIRQERALVWQTTGTLLPTLQTEAALNHSRTNGASESTQYRQGFDSSWEIDLFGGKRRAVEAAAYGLNAAQEDLRATLVTMIGDIASNYVTTRGLQQKLALAKRTAAAQRRTAALTHDKFAAGAVSKLDLANAEGQAASTEASIPELEASLAVHIHRLAVLSGRTPAELNDHFKNIGRIPTPPWPIPAGLPADILLNRPDIRAAEYQYAQATAKIGQAEAARYPALTLTGNIATAANQIGDLGKNSTIGWSFGPGLTVPIFNGGQRRAAVLLAQAQRDQFFVSYQAQVLNSLEEVENALVNLSRERQRAVKLRQASQAYATSLTLSRQLYQGGNTSFLELLNAERSSYSADSALIDSEVNLTNDYIALMKALGGGWDGSMITNNQEVVDTNTGPHFERVKQENH